MCCLCVCLWLYLLNGAIRRTRMLARLIQDENTFPYVSATSCHQKQFHVSWRPLLYTAWKWWLRTAKWCHLKSLLCCTWWVRINAINCGVLVMGKAMKQVPKQEQATLQIIIPQLIAQWWSESHGSLLARRSPHMKWAWGFGLALARAVYKVQQGYKKNSVPGGRFGSLHFLPLGSSYASGWKHFVGSDLGDLDIILDPDKLSKYICLFFLTTLLAKLVGVFHLMSTGLTIILPSVKVWVKIFCLRWHCPACPLWWDPKPDWVEADLSMPMPYT